MRCKAIAASMSLREVHIHALIDAGNGDKLVCDDTQRAGVRSSSVPPPCFTRRRGVRGEVRSPGVVSLRALTCVPTRVGVWCVVLRRVWGQGGGEGGDGVGDRLRIAAGQAVPAVGDEL